MNDANISEREKKTLDILQEEYKSIKGDISFCMGELYKVANFFTVISGALIGGIFAKDVLSPFLIVLLMLFGILMLLGLEFMIIGLLEFVISFGKYKAIIEGKINTILGHKILMWESKLVEKVQHFSPGVMMVFIVFTFITISLNGIVSYISFEPEVAIASIKTIIPELDLKYIIPHDYEKLVQLFCGLNIILQIYAIQYAILRFSTFGVLPKHIDEEFSGDSRYFKAHTGGVASALATFVMFGIFVFTSIWNETFWFNSIYDLPVSKLPSIWLGDAFLLPFFNYRLYKLINFYMGYDFGYFRKNINQVVGLILLSLFFDYIFHMVWIRDSHSGFIDINSALTLAGNIHFGFTFLQLFLVFLFITICFTIYQKRMNMEIVKYANETWIVLILFTMCGFGDVLFKHYNLFKYESYWQSYLEDWTSIIAFFIATVMCVCFNFFIKSRLPCTQNNVEVTENL